jgi:hypothetical protein
MLFKPAAKVIPLHTPSEPFREAQLLANEAVGQGTSGSENPYQTRHLELGYTSDLLVTPKTLGVKAQACSTALSKWVGKYQQM